MYLLNLSIAFTAFTSLVAAAPPHQHKARGKCSGKPSSGNPWSSTAGQPSQYGTHPTGNTWTGPTTTHCYTGWGSTSVPWASSTEWSTHYTSCTSTSTVTSTITTAPPSTTTTVTITSTTTTTAPTSSFTSTVTSTATTSTSVTTTTTSTVTSTATTTTTSTSTVPSSSGFIPVQTSLPGMTYTGGGGANPVSKRSTSNSTIAGVSPRYQFPQGITCHQYQKASCSVSTITTVKTVQGTSTGTVTSTSTSTITSTIVPSATTTITSITTSTSTVTETDTATSTTTTTTTSTTVATTVYAACATNNFGDRYQGHRLLSFFQTAGTPSNVDTSEASTAYDCCVAAFLDPNIAQVWFYDSIGFTTTGSCQIFYGSQCAAQSDNQYQVQYITQVANRDNVVGNAYCGEVNSAALQ